MQQVVLTVQQITLESYLNMYPVSALVISPWPKKHRMSKCNNVIMLLLRLQIRLWSYIKCMSCLKLLFSIGQPAGHTDCTVP
jgi:hypothetical protein